jgi:septum formation protein
MTASRGSNGHLDPSHHVGAENGVEARPDDRNGALDLTPPLRVAGAHDQNRVTKFDHRDAIERLPDGLPPGKGNLLLGERGLSKHLGESGRDHGMDGNHSGRVAPTMMAAVVRLPRFVLASASPRRAELLLAAGFDFDVIPGTADETIYPSEEADAYVRRVALAKAATVSSRANGRLIISADTVVVVDGQILGKPDNSEDARRMLQLMSGRRHVVMTGVHLAGPVPRTEVESTTVYFSPLSSEDIAWYVQSGEPADKAGGYAIQGLASRFVDQIVGSYSNVVGLPIALVYRMLAGSRD